MSRTLRRNQLIALLAVCALAFCSALYAAHGLGDRAHDHEHCDLCVHFSGATGASPAAKVVGQPVFLARQRPAPTPTILPARFPVGLYLPRGPPATPVLS